MFLFVLVRVFPYGFVSVRPKTEQNLFSVIELAPVRHACLELLQVSHRWIIHTASNKAAMLTLKDIR